MKMRTTAWAFLLALIATPSSGDETSGLLAHWSFDRCDGKDESGNGYHGIVNGAVRCVEGVQGNALEFTGAQYIEIPAQGFLDGSCDLTITAWVSNQARDLGWHQVFAIGDERSALDPVSVQFTADMFEPDTPGQTTLNNVSFEDTTQREGISFHPYYFNFSFENDKWYFLSVVLETSGIDTNMYIYVNGNLVYTVSKDARTCVRHDQPMIANIGAIDSGAQGWIGYLDEVRIYKRALGRLEIQRLYNAKSIIDPRIEIGKIAQTAGGPGRFPHQAGTPVARLNLSLFDMENDGDLDVAVTIQSPAAEHAETFWLSDGAGHFALAPPGYPVAPKEGRAFAGYNYQVDALDLDKNGCLDAYMVHPLDGNEGWIDDGFSSFNDSGRARALRLNSPPDVLRQCPRTVDPSALIRTLSESPWSHFF